MIILNKNQIFKKINHTLYRLKCILFIQKVIKEPTHLVSIQFTKSFLPLALGYDYMDNNSGCTIALKRMGLIKGKSFNTLIELRNNYRFTKLGREYVRYAFPNMQPHNILANFNDLNSRYKNRINMYSWRHPQISELGFLHFITIHHLWNKFDPDGANISNMERYIFSDHPYKSAELTRAPVTEPMGSDLLDPWSDSDFIDPLGGMSLFL